MRIARTLALVSTLGFGLAHADETPPEGKVEKKEEKKAAKAEKKAAKKEKKAAKKAEEKKG